MLRTDRCILLPPQQQDYESLRDLYTNEEVRRHLGGPADEQVFRARFAARVSSRFAPSYWVIRRASDNEFIGSVSLATHHDGVSTEISYQLVPQWWGQGYGTEAVQRIIKHAFEDLGLTRLLAETQTANTASCRLLEKVGMRLEQTLERFGAEQAIYSIANTRLG